MTAKIGLLAIGQADATVLLELKDGLATVFPDTTFAVIDAGLPMPRRALDKNRGQHRSDIILSEVQAYAVKRKNLRSVLGVVDADIFVSELNFVFGEAACPGKAAVISTSRLKPEFYGEPPNNELFAERVLKEAVHELGHTLGLKHCTRSSCVMHFSNSIFDTDRKQSAFCDECYLKVALSVNNLR
ncbi:MAG: archaemetzincin family Zn-dependent metalloprotease [Candidatus Bathyarchaeota archaeon]|nr:archaemetzincin family Zn-dependent metalloprotease [Candidatus Bathyarchaeota archaeon]